MLLRRLRVKEFRNLAAVDLQLSPGMLVLEGENGQGKTSLLEAIACLAWGRSFRTSQDRILLREGAAGFHIEGSLVTGSGEKSITLGYDRTGKRLFRQNGQDLARKSGFLSALKIVLFTPEDLGLLKGGPENRRRFLDWDLGQADPLYRDSLLRYYHVLRQRNRLLHQGLSRPLPQAELVPWNEALAAAAVSVMHWRGEALASLQDAATDLHHTISGRGGFRVTYLPQYTGLVEASAFLSSLDRIAAAERKRGVTLLGPHRDDLGVCLGNRDLRVFGSQGEQRTAAIVLKHAALFFLSQVLGEAPLLLLDDVLSELDPPRRQALLSLSPAAQRILTSAEPLPWPPATRRLLVRRGQVIGPEAGI